MKNNYVKKLGRRLARTWGRVHGPRRGNSKRVASKGCRAAAKIDIKSSVHSE